VDNCPVEPYSTQGVKVTASESGEWREVRTVLSPAPPSGEVAAAKTGGGEIETVRRYRRMAAASGGATGRPAWRLEQLRQTVRENGSSGPRSIRTETDIQYVHWHRNAGKDAARREAAAKRPRPAAEPRPQGQPRQAAMAPPSADAEAASVGTASIDVCGRKSSRVNHVVVPGGTPVIWQHGICSEASVWDGLRSLVSSNLAVGHERAFSLTSRERLDLQTSELEAEVAATGGGRNIMVAHSQGGLIARRFAQRRNDLVHGVITMGTPHQGALVADLGPELVADYVHDAVGDCFGWAVCRIVDDLAIRRATGEVTYGLAGAVVPVIHDVRTNSDFTNQLNSTYEPYLRAGIEVDAGNRWALMRFLGDLNSPRTRVVSGARPDGPAWVRTTENVYRAGLFLQDLAMFLQWRAYPYGGGVGCGYSGYRTYWPPCYDYYYYDYWHTSSYWSQLAALLYSIGNFVTVNLDRLDRMWNYVTTRHSDLTDGFIQFSSQQYPSSPGAYTPLRYVIRPPEADSHAGETASPAAYRRIRSALEQMGVQRR
jgi:pimeloyl-ACP methyl ester carboxylesterase